MTVLFFVSPVHVDFVEGKEVIPSSKLHLRYNLTLNKYEGSRKGKVVMIGSFRLGIFSAHTIALYSSVKCDGVGCIIYQQVYMRMDIHQHIYLLINDTVYTPSHFTVLIIATWYPLRTYTMSTSHRNPQMLKLE